jgi:hypothetical protein
LSLLKAFRKLEKDDSIRKIVLYTTAPKVIRNLLTMSSKPHGSSLSIAVSLAFHEITNTHPDVEIQVKGFSKAGSVGETMFNVDHGFKYNATWAFTSAQDARHFGRHRSFPESAPYQLVRNEITKDSVLLWRDGFDNETDKSCYHGQGWLDSYEVTGKDWQRVLPSHLSQGPWLRNYRGITAANSSTLGGRLVRTATKHAPIGEFRSRFFPDKPPEDLHGTLHAPETRTHILNHCSWYVRRVDHYKGGIDTIPGLILFLIDNPTAFSFDPTERKRIYDPDWQSYRREVYRQRDATNEIREKKKLPLETGPIFYHETLEYYQERGYVYEDEEMEARRARRVSFSPYHFLLLSVSFVYVSLIQFHSSVR